MYTMYCTQVGLLKNLASPNIVKLHTCFVDHNALWVVMDWMDGGDLKGAEVSVLLFVRTANSVAVAQFCWGHTKQIAVFGDSNDASHVRSAASPAPLLASFDMDGQVSGEGC